MAKIEMELSDRVESDIERMVNNDEFVNWDEAVEKLLTQGLNAYGPAEEESEELGGDMFQQSVADQQDPAMRDEPGNDEFTL
jgi:Arc/MetJ-type ribon-helix-helix transcriptional regulator